MPDSPLRQAALEVESHVGDQGWDQAPRLFALVPTAGEGFVADRARLVTRLRTLSTADWARTARHGE